MCVVWQRVRMHVGVQARPKKHVILPAGEGDVPQVRAEAGEVEHLASAPVSTKPSRYVSETNLGNASSRYLRRLKVGTPPSLSTLHPNQAKSFRYVGVL